MSETFGEYLRDKREAGGINLRKMAELLEIAPAYLSDIEKGKRNSPSSERLTKIASILNLNEDDKSELFDLAALNRNEVPLDISAYIISSKMIRMALRKAKSLEYDDQKWLRIIEIMEEGEHHRQ